MNKPISVIILACLIMSFSSCGKLSWTKEEKRLINQQGKIMKVLTVDNPTDSLILRKTCTDIPLSKIGGKTYNALVAKMKATVTDPSQDGVGIAGPQVGISRRIVVVQRLDKEGEPFIAYPNIRIIAKRGEEVCGPEGCLSVPDRRGTVSRSRNIEIRYVSPLTLKDTTEMVRGFTAVIFQHECDHLDGILYTDRIWENEKAWCKSREINDNYGDVFYLTSTNVLQSRRSDGTISYTSLLSPQDMDVLEKENRYIEARVFSDSLNFFAPYYHQFTLETVGLEKQQYDSVYNEVSKEVCEAFDYYIKHENKGRKFVLAGFSQGAMLVKDVLKHMSEDDYSRMVAAYVLGDGISEEELQSSRIKPATGPLDKGVTVSFNSVADIDYIWPLVWNNSVCCINPVNWMTDSTPAKFEYKGQTLTASIDKDYQVLVVKGFTGKWDPGFILPWPEGNLHHYEILFYAPMLGQNAKDRMYR